MGTKLETSGALVLDTSVSVTLSDVEAFCAEARALGLGDKAVMYTTRQGFVGPVLALRFVVPVEPKKPDA